MKDNSQYTPDFVQVMSFSDALELLKMGHWVSRMNWCNDGSIRVVMQKGYPQGIPCNKQTAEAWGMSEGDIFIVEPYFQISRHDGSHEMWSPTAIDCLSEDWYTF